MSSGVEFDEDSLKYAPRRPAAGGGFQPSPYGIPGQQGGGNQPGMVAWLMRKGIVKSPAVGQVILIGLVVVNIVVTIIVIMYFL
jgi:hypothetical protein